MLATPSEAGYASLEDAETMVLSHVINESYNLSRTQRSAAQVRPGRFGWLVHATPYNIRQEYLTEDLRKLHSSTCRLKCPCTVTIKRGTADNDNSSDHTIYFSSCASAVYISSLWMSKTASPTTKDQRIYQLIPPRVKIVLKMPRRSVPWQEHVLHPMLSWRQSFKTIQTPISF